MNKKGLWVAGGFLLGCVAYIGVGATSASGDVKTAPQIAVVDFKACIEGSKLGRQEQSRFDEIKKQMESTLESKEKELNEMAPKFKDEYIDTLTPEAEAELKEKYKHLSQEFSVLQNQYYQLLNQANYQIVQKMQDWIDSASEKVAKDKKIDIVLNQEACFYKAPSFDISNDIIKELDTRFAEEEKKAPKNDTKKN